MKLHFFTSQNEELRQSSYVFGKFIVDCSIIFTRVRKITVDCSIIFACVQNNIVECSSLACVRETSLLFDKLVPFPKITVDFSLICVCVRKNTVDY